MNLLRFEAEKEIRTNNELNVCRPFYTATLLKNKETFYSFLTLLWHDSIIIVRMAYNNGQPQYVITQPQPQAQIVVQVDPFKQFHNEWSVGLCDCCEDTSQCELLTYPS
jgi:hypothetical protein